MRTLTYIILLCLGLSNCYAKVGKSAKHISSIYINTPDSSVKASITDQPREKLHNGRFYHWYAANQVCVTNGAYSGKLLHGTYSSFFSNHFLQAQGEFRYGLKDGCWKRWLSDGSIHEIIHYKNGLLNGTYDIYSPDGKLQQRIYYRDGLRAGKTIFFSQDGKDSVILYKKGIQVVKKERGTRNGEWGTGNGESNERKGDSTLQKVDSLLTKKTRNNSHSKKILSDSANKKSSRKKTFLTKSSDSINQHGSNSGNANDSTHNFLQRWRLRSRKNNSQDTTRLRINSTNGSHFCGGLSNNYRNFTVRRLLLPDSPFPIPHSSYRR